MTVRHPEFDAEQRYLIAARAALSASIEHVDRLLATAKVDKNNPDAQALAANLTGRVRRLRDAGGQAACFARLDDEDADVFYIGRQHIADAAQNPLVIDWRARAAEPFYRATALHPMGCVRRRQFVLEGDTLQEIYDTDLTDPHAGAGIPDPLLAEINRARTGSMREIVATIQTEQDRIVRAPLEQTLVVQGGPGTGKTAVGLHRAAYLLFEHREQLSREGVLVVGPNRRFLDYISDVLPSLGERSFRQIVPSDLADIDLPSSAHMATELRRLIGDPRMTAVVRTHLARVAVPPTEDVRIRTDLGSATIEAAAAARQMSEALAANDRVGTAREAWMSGLIRDLRADVKRFSAGGVATTASEFARAVRKSNAFTEFVRAHWPGARAEAAVRSMWRALPDTETLWREAGFHEADLAVLAQRKPRQPLSEVDRPLIDEVAWHLGHRCVQYGHVILDEAQDLSPMALRMVARRAQRRSFTVLGDVAQCSGDWMYDDWSIPLRSLANERTPVELAELTVGYRVPDEFIALANALLPSIAPDLAPTTSVRPAAAPARWLATSNEDRLGVAADVAARLSKRFSTVAVIANHDLHEALIEALRASGIAADPGIQAGGHGGADGSDGSATVDVLDPTEAKGLEFDAVVLVEPADMYHKVGSWRPLFVALTRAVQHLEMIGARPLPHAIGALLPTG